MAKLEYISNTSWRQPFENRTKELHLWSSHKRVADYCEFKDGEKRCLRILFEPIYDIDVIDYFQITSGREISFPRNFQKLIKDVVFNNPESSFTVEVIDNKRKKLANGNINTTGTATIQTRVGQQKYRKSLFSYWGGCALTGLSIDIILRASHIKPWCVSTNHERLDPYNGLLLSPLYDALFDKGLISFNDKGEILIAKSICKHKINLGITNDMKLRKISDQHIAYLKYHRKLYMFDVDF